MDDETIMGDYGNKKIPISRAQYRANGYKRAIGKLTKGPSRCHQERQAIPKPAPIDRDAVQRLLEQGARARERPLPRVDANQDD
jgi:hypothetical protein